MLTGQASWNLAGAATKTEVPVTGSACRRAGRGPKNVAMRIDMKHVPCTYQAMVTNPPHAITFKRPTSVKLNTGVLAGRANHLRQGYGGPPKRHA